MVLSIFPGTTSQGLVNPSKAPQTAIGAERCVAWTQLEKYTAVGKLPLGKIPLGNYLTFNLYTLN